MTRRGATLLEILIGVALLALVAGSITRIGNAGSRTFKTGSIRSDLDQRARRTMERVVRTTLTASQGSFNVFPGNPPWDDRVIFDHIDDVASDTGAVAWTTTRVELDYAEGEIDDGIDNNGNGIADEGVVRLIRRWGAPDQQAVTLCGDVREYLEGEVPNGLDDNGNGLIDERGLCFERNGELLTIRITLEVRDSENRTATRTLETSAFIRN